MSETKAQVAYERDLNVEAIMLMRGHLAAVGREATFADDAAAIAAYRYRRTRDALRAIAHGRGRAAELARDVLTEIKDDPDPYPS